MAVTVIACTTHRLDHGVLQSGCGSLEWSRG